MSSVVGAGVTISRRNQDAINIQLKNRAEVMRMTSRFSKPRKSLADNITQAVKQYAFIGERGIKKAITTGPTRAIDTGFMRASTRAFFPCQA